MIQNYDRHIVQVTMPGPDRAVFYGYVLHDDGTNRILKVEVTDAGTSTYKPGARLNVDRHLFTDHYRPCQDDTNCDHGTIMVSFLASPFEHEGRRPIRTYADGCQAIGGNL